MVTDWAEVAKDLSGLVGQVMKGSPEVMKGFFTMERAAVGAGALDAKTKELMALALGIAARCQGCIAFHTREAVKLGATRAEVMETVAVAAAMGGGPSVMYGSMAVEAFDQFAAKG